jgi:ABC-type antimicrobial peptide transport system permease subunit
MALGARTSEVTGMFLRHAAFLSAIGIAVGLAAAFGLTRLMCSLLFNVSLWRLVGNSRMGLCRNFGRNSTQRV